MSWCNIFPYNSAKLASFFWNAKSTSLIPHFILTHSKFVGQNKTSITSKQPEGQKH